MLKRLRHIRWGCSIGLIGIGVLGLYALKKVVTGSVHDFRDISFDVDGDRIVFNAIGQGKRDLFLLNLSTGRVSRLTDSKAREFAPRFAPDGRQIVYAAYPSASTSTPSTLYRLNVQTLQAHSLTQSQSADFEPRYLPDGKSVLFERAHRLRPYSLGGTVWDQAETHLLDMSTGTVYPFGVDLLGGNVSPDGKLLVRMGAKVYLLDLTVVKDELDVQDVEKNRERVTASLKQDALCSFLTGLLSKRFSGDVPISLHEWVWVEDGRALVFLGIVAGSSFEYELWYVRRDGSGLRRLTHLHTYLECLRYDAKRNFLYFLRLENAMGMVKSLWRLHLPSGRLEKVADATLFSDPLSYSEQRKNHMRNQYQEEPISGRRCLGELNGERAALRCVWL